ncbi:fungal-specific transcription factor domain-containing protein [Mycena rebaudengoi]|nr:fungal-specific transcription factor domain-containing protein [Mycena rebaudengoi]
MESASESSSFQFVSENAQDPGRPDPGSKRRRLRGACDMCKQKKTRCDSAKMPGGVCSNCIAYNCECTHQGNFKYWNAPNPQSTKSSSVSSTAQGCRNEKSAQDHVDSILVHSTAYIAPEDLRNVLLDVARYCRSLEQELSGYRQLESSSGVEPTALSPAAESDTLDQDSHTHGIVVNTGSAANEESLLIDALKTMNMKSAESRFLGKSNSLFLIYTALAMKGLRGHDGPNSQAPAILRRPQFWSSPWEKPPFTPLPDLKFPPEDLLHDLFAIYFSRIHILTGLLHRPTFEESIACGLHLFNHRFGEVVLAVCALAARFSDDPRVILAGTDSHLSAGWEWYQQVKPFRSNLAVPPTLYDLQLVVLAIVYLQGTSSQEACWPLCAAGVRDAQEIGIHVRKCSDKKTMTIEDELFKRAFWMLISCDALICSFLGRPRVTNDYDYDIDYPVEVDDEYWENVDPEKRFLQPPGKPSMYTFLTLYLKLIEILGLTHKNIYSPQRSQRDKKWIETAVTELDSALNKWVDSIPDYLRWDPNREEEPFASQSACLYTSYYHVQIQVHRTFIPSPTNKKPLSSTFPSLAICANSARSCSRVMEVQAKRSLLVHPQPVNAMLDSAVILSLNVWGGRKTGAAADPQMATNDVQKCIMVLQMYERHWQSAGRYCDTLYSIGPIASPTELPSLKRGRMSEALLPCVSGPSYSGPRSLAGSQRVSSAIEEQQQSVAALADANFNYLFGLPIHSQDLGDLPVYESFEWDLPFGSDTTHSLGAGFSFDSAASLYGLNTDMPHMGHASDSTQYSQFNTPGHAHGQWDDWGSSTDDVDQLINSFLPEGEASQ